MCISDRTVNPDGADVKVVATWLRDGNHPNWLEDGRLSMNYEGKVCAFDDVEGASCQVLSERASGHPVGVPGRGDLVVTDTYAKEHAAFGLEAGDRVTAWVEAQQELGLLEHSFQKFMLLTHLVHQKNKF